MNAMERLSREIERVTELRRLYEDLRRLPHYSPLTEIPIAGMAASIARAHQVAGSGDTLEVLAAISDLAEWAE